DNAMLSTARAVIDEASDQDVRKQMILLLGYVGDAQTLEFFQSRLLQDDVQGWERESVDRAIRHLSRKLELDDPKQDSWRRFGRLYWRINREVSLPRKIGVEYEFAARLLAERDISVPTAFLAVRIADHD